jgi:hypothetical protein
LRSVQTAQVSPLTRFQPKFYPPFLIHVPTPVVAQTLFVGYSILLHVLALLFPLRLCASAYAATQGVRKAHGSARKTLSTDLLELDLQHDTHNKAASVTMAIILPSYKEDIEILESSLRVLASHRLARSSYDVGRCCMHECRVLV